MARELTRAQAAQNRAFPKALARTGNVRLACRELGLKYGTMQHRRRVHPAFAARIDAALAFAQASLEKKSGKEGRWGQKAARRPLSQPSPAEGSGLHRTIGGEPTLVRLASGKLQMRRAQPGKLTHECEQAFLAALSATANVTLSAAAAGASPRAFYRRKRQCPAFARELRLALQRGYETLENALLESTLAASHDHSDWRHNEPPAMPPMSASQALQLMYLHQKAVLLIDEGWPFKRRAGESREAYGERLTALAEERARRVREEFEVAEAERSERGEPAWGPAGEEVRARLGLPDLAQVWLSTTLADGSNSSKGSCSCAMIAASASSASTSDDGGLDASIGPNRLLPSWVDSAANGGVPWRTSVNRYRLGSEIPRSIRRTSSACARSRRWR